MECHPFFEISSLFTWRTVQHKGMDGGNAFPHNHGHNQCDINTNPTLGNFAPLVFQQVCSCLHCPEVQVFSPGSLRVVRAVSGEASVGHPASQEWSLVGHSGKPFPGATPRRGSPRTWWNQNRNRWFKTSSQEIVLSKDRCSLLEATVLQLPPNLPRGRQPTPPRAVPRARPGNPGQPLPPAPPAPPRRGIRLRHVPASRA